jgi:hypothetical protein
MDDNAILARLNANITATVVESFFFGVRLAEAANGIGKTPVDKLTEILVAVAKANRL